MKPFVARAVTTFTLGMLAIGGCSSAENRAAGPGGSGGSGGGGGSGAGVTFTVPAQGGPVDVTTGSGRVMSFDFPASAAGRTVVLTPTSASAIGWRDGDFVDVIELAPDGMTFTDPVIVRPQNEAGLVLHFSGGGSKPMPEVLEPNAAGDGLELRHFSHVALFPDTACEVVNVHDLSPRCMPLEIYTGPNSPTTEIGVSCKTGNGCVDYSVSCCTVMGHDQCSLGSALNWTRNEVDSAACRGGDGGAGGTGGGCKSTFSCATTTAQCGTVVDNCGDSHDVVAECSNIHGCGERGACANNRCGTCTPYASCAEAKTATGSCSATVSNGCGGTITCEATPCEDGTTCLESLDEPGYFSCRTPCTTDAQCPRFVPECVGSQTVTIGGFWCEKASYCLGIRGESQCRDDAGNPSACVNGACVQ